MAEHHGASMSGPISRFFRARARRCGPSFRGGCAAIYRWCRWCACKASSAFSTPLRAGPVPRLASHASSTAPSHARRPRGRARDQFARRLAGAVASDLPPHPRACCGEETAGDRLRRGCRGVRRLHDRLRGRRDHLRCRPPSSDRSAWSAARSASSKLIEKLGIERRLYTSGEHKAMLDPFLPEKPEDVARLKALQHDIHEGFHRAREGEPRRASSRAPKMPCSPANIGPAARRSNLASPTESAICVRRCAQRYGDKVEMPLVAAERSLFGRTRPGVRQP